VPVTDKDTSSAPPLHVGQLYTVDALSIPDGTEEWSVMCDGSCVLTALVMVPDEHEAFLRLVHCRNVIDGIDEDTLPDALERDLLVLAAEINDQLARRIVERLNLGGFASYDDTINTVRELIATAWDRTEDGSHA
jgi:hypothetical protein